MTSNHRENLEKCTETTEFLTYKLDPMNFTVLTITITPLDDDIRDLLISELGDIGFEGFLENELGFEASINAENIDRDQLKDVFSRFTDEGLTIHCTERKELDRNWNEEWEKKLRPRGSGRSVPHPCAFPSPQGKLQIEMTIMPRMSFGTGHHGTTAGMIELMLTHPLRSPLLDMGSGTAVLAIVSPSWALRT